MEENVNRIMINKKNTKHTVLKFGIIRELVGSMFEQRYGPGVPKAKTQVTWTRLPHHNHNDP